MNIFGKPGAYWKKAISNDAKALLKNTDGQTSSLKALMLTAGVAICVALVFTLTSKPPTALSETPDITLPVVPLETALDLYDNRPLNERSVSKSTALSLTLKSGQSLGPLLQKNGIDPNIAYSATQAFSTAYNPKNLRVGQKINLYFDESGNNFTGLSLKPNYSDTVFVQRGQNGAFKARKTTAEFQKRLMRIDTDIENSLYLDAQALGAPDKITVQFSHIYAHSVDFQRDIQKGDKFEMLFELYTDHNGNTVKAGDLIYTSFSPRGKKADYYLYTKKDGRDGYYDLNGKGAKRMLMRTPINGARMSSRFGRRKHPILGYRKNHTGVDFAAPRGTPIFAAGTGTITHAGRYGGYGNYIKIRHSDGYQTAYGHMKKFARSSKRGRRVVQGQVIGYVGTTGLSTGPHLHYEVHKNGKRINPMRLSTLTGKPLKKAELPAFKTRAAEIDVLYKATQITMRVPELTAQLPEQIQTDAVTSNN